MHGDNLFGEIFILVLCLTTNRLLLRSDMFDAMRKIFVFDSYYLLKEINYSNTLIRIRRIL